MLTKVESEGVHNCCDYLHEINTAIYDIQTAHVHLALFADVLGIQLIEVHEMVPSGLCNRP